MDFEKIVAVIASVVLILLIIGASAAVIPIYRLKAHGRIKGIGVEIYADLGGTALVTEIDWGFLDPGEVKNLTVYIKNTGNVPVVLYLSTENWYPIGADAYISLSWDYNFTALEVDELRSATFTLSVASGITGIVDFSFDIIVTAEG